MKKFLTVIAILPLFFVFIGCSGGGGGSDDTDPNKLFQLRDGAFKPGQQSSFSLKGTDTMGGKFEGALLAKTNSAFIFEGELITPVEKFLSLTNTVRDVFISNVSTIYFDANQAPIAMFSGNDPVIMYLPTKISLVPETAKIGDFGVLTSWIDDNGGTSSGTWVLESNSSDLADLVTMYTFKDNFGNVDLYEEDTMTIDETGYATSISIKIYIPQHEDESEVTINLTGKRTS